MNMEVQIGGLRESLLDFLKRTSTFQSVLLYILFILMIVFKNMIPPIVYDQADTFLGRLFTLFLVAFLTKEYGWILGLLAALSIALLLGLPKGQSIREGFGSGGETALQVVPTSKKWFVERALHENPIAIEEEKVITSAIQTDSESGVSGGVQNTSVT
jgi:hypothetical protein